MLSFVQHYLAPEHGSDMRSAELWGFYAEVAAAGELEPLSKAQFLRRLPGAMETAFGVKKSHSIMRGGQTVRGFKSVTIREETSPMTTLELEAKYDHQLFEDKWKVGDPDGATASNGCVERRGCKCARGGRCSLEQAVNVLRGLAVLLR